MAAPYSTVTVSNYNLNPPTDDGQQTATNQLKWSTIKTKLADTLKSALESINTNVGTAFGKVLAGGSTVEMTTDVTVDGDDQGTTFVHTSASAHELTLPDATEVGSPFAFALKNDGTGLVTVTPDGSQTVSGLSSLKIRSGQGGIFVTDGADWFYIGTYNDSPFAAGTVLMFGNTNAPAGWTKDTSFDDAVIALTTGSAGDVAGSALSDVLKARTIAKLNLPDFDVTITDPGHLHSGGFAHSGSLIDGYDGGAQWQVGNANTGSSTTGITAAFGSTARGGSQTTMDFAAKRAKVIRATKS